MDYPNAHSALRQYGQVGIQSEVAFATPHRLIQMLMGGALEKLSVAKGHMSRGEVEPKGRYISWAISIIEGLRMSLDREAGGEIADNLDRLYDYMKSRLLHANLHDDVREVDEVVGLLHEIKGAWDAIAPAGADQPAKGEGDTASPIPSLSIGA